MNGGLSKKLSGLFIFLSIVTFVAFSKGRLTLIEFQLYISVLLALRVGSSNVSSVTSPQKTLYSAWDDGLYGRYKIGVAALVFFSVIAQIVVLFTFVPAEYSAVVLIIAGISVAILILLNVIAVEGKLPRIVTRHTDHQE